MTTGGGHVPNSAPDAAERNLAAKSGPYEPDNGELLALRREQAILRAELAMRDSMLHEARREAAFHVQVTARLTRQLIAERERAHAMRGHLKRIHQAPFVGHVHDYILRACLALTGATRGAYIHTPLDGPPQVRASVGMEQSDGGQPSCFVGELAERARRTQDAFVCNDGVGHDSQPRPRCDDERFRNYAVAPIVLMRDLDGVIVVADKPQGRIDEKDMSMLVSIGDHASVAVENARLRRELEGAYLSTVSLLADAAEARDAYTHGHCETVSRLARHTAAALGMDEDGVRVTCYAALLHDVGKIGVSDSILHKAGPLLPEEQELMRKHVHVGYDLLRAVPVLADVAEVVLRHHEWWDGNGYPGGMRGDAIPLAARVVAVVDAYCAMVDRRCYKESVSDAAARTELRRCAGTQFDPAAVEAFVKVLDDPDIAGHDGDIYSECGLPPLLKATH